MAIELLINAGDGVGAEAVANGTHTAICFGTFGTGTVTLEASFDGTTWVPVPDASFTGNSIVNANLARGTRIRGSASGGVTLVSLVLI